MTQEQKAKFLDDLIERLENAREYANTIGDYTHKEHSSLSDYFGDYPSKIARGEVLTDWFEKSGVALEL